MPRLLSTCWAARIAALNPELSAERGEHASFDGIDFRIPQGAVRRPE
jgi:hypothetical protein